jgi:hypothetical protein
MSLYVQLALDYPNRIIGIYIRDVTTPFIPNIAREPHPSSIPPISSDEPSPIDSSSLEPPPPSSFREFDVPGSFGDDRQQFEDLGRQNSDPADRRPLPPRRSQTEPNIAQHTLTSDQFNSRNGNRNGSGMSEEGEYVSEERVALIEQFYARIAEAERSLKRAGSTQLRIFRHGGECQEESNNWIKAANRSR